MANRLMMTSLHNNSLDLKCKGLESSNIDRRKNGQVSPEKLYLNTPVILSHPMSKLTNLQIFLKLENLQPPGSFKIRGISHMIQKAMQTAHCSHVYCASGGNAGLAAAHASKELKVPCTIVLPTTTPSFIADQLLGLGAVVRVHGDVYDEAKKLAVELGKKPGSLYVPAFEHPDIWEGHSSLIQELSQQVDVRPGAIITSVGGGGLLNGVIEGMREVGWQDVPVIAVETEGANCFSAAIEAGELVTLPAITSVAKCLGALTVSPTSLQYYQEAQPPIISTLVTDKEAVSACLQFAEDHRFLVEPACGASLAVIYSQVLQRLIDQKLVPAISSALVIVCGGAMVSTAVMEGWKSEFSL